MENKILGCDISSWQDLNSTPQMYDPWKTRKQNGFFVGIKVSQANWIDPDFIMNWKNCKNVLYEMPYHFLTFDIDAKKQAETFWGALEKNVSHGILPLICDFEWWGSSTPSNVEDMLYNFMETMKVLSSPLPLGIYTSRGFWLYNTTQNIYWKQYKLWLCDISGPVEPCPPWTSWTFHQYTFKLPGPLWGAESLDLDGDYYNGTLEQMMAEYNLSPLQEIDGEITPPPPPEFSGSPLYMKCIKNVNIRSGPSTSYADVGDFYVGDIVGPVLNVAGGKSGAWIQISNNQWVCVSDIYQNNYLVKLEV